MKTLTFAVQEGTRPELVVEIQALRILFGSGAHCDVRLPPEVAAWEHVVVTLEEESIIARVVPGDRTALFDGVAARETELAEGAVFSIGNVTVRLTRVVQQDVVVARGNPLRAAALGVAILAVLAGVFLLGAGALESEAKAPPAPDPLGAPIMACPEARGALPLAHQKLELARSKEQRFRFYPRDGVDAVGLYETAAACFRVGKDQAGAADAVERARWTRRQLNEAFHASRVRLDRALIRKDPTTALRQVKFQRELLFGNEHAEAYSMWLSLLQSKLEAAVSKES